MKHSKHIDLKSNTFEKSRPRLLKNSGEIFSNRDKFTLILSQVLYVEATVTPVCKFQH